jgi:hypothetical protein
MHELDTSTPVLLLGGADNSVSICRHLGRRGITVKVSGNPNTCWGLHSRYCREQFLIPQGMEPRDYRAKLLLSPDSVCAARGVCLQRRGVGSRQEPRQDVRAISFLFRPELQLALLDKQKR